jgi:2-amino-4-hydroxy-6-hydroxymethyldihydropteridine diphosphokinase
MRAGSHSIRVRETAPAMPTTAYIALGSNLGDRRVTLDAAVEALRQTPGVTVTRVSSVYETEPVGGPAGQGKYLNAVAEVQADLPAPDLLRALLAIEDRLGRVRAERFGPRTMDLDLLLYGTETHDVHEPGIDLTVPHPRLHERLFVLEPLAEIAPLAVHPVLQSTAADLLRRLREAPPGRELTGQTAVVTGSTSGIGRAIALELAAAGANVVIHGRRSRAAAEHVARDCRDRGVQAHVVLADLRDPPASAKLVEAAWALGPGIDVWVNNAGADIVTGDAARWEFDRKLEELWLVDVRATMMLSRAIGRRMHERGHGVILTTGWDQAETGTELEAGQLFGATKGAVMCFTRSLAVALAPRVRVNCLAPGWIRTAWGEQASPPWHDRVRRETPLDRWGTPEDVARAARWLASPAAAFLTGQTIRVNGGAVRL